ncbi:carbonic anhydrase [Kribbella capetownensis]|uniref:carbonic anhydrase n=1 Tax=Kribbella capetownensis TaxID=1572659 RepID=UPI001EDDF42A|nr:carbonic anhydrase [Kribbella capetownensis]
MPVWSRLSRRRILGLLAGGATGAVLTGCSGDASPEVTPAAEQVAGGTLPPTTGPKPPASPSAPSAVVDGNQALRRLLDGNARFVAGLDEELDEGIARRVAVSKAQHPFATVLGCIDSRVPIELIFDQGLGDLVVVRSAGEALDHSVTGSVEFGVAELHTPLLVVLGHQRCGALDATIKALDSDQRTAEAGELRHIVDTLAPAVRQVAGKPGDRLTNAVHANVELVLAKLRQSPVIGPLEKSGKLKLVGAYYELDTGKVHVN